MNTPQKGILVSIYKDSKLGDCSNGGISAIADTALLVSSLFVKVPQVVEESDEYPKIKIVEGTLSGTLKAVPYDKPKGKISMFGGCFVWECDSRFRKISQHPIPLHDRFE